MVAPTIINGTITYFSDNKEDFSIPADKSA